jgi:hypothetical protein
MIVSVWLPALSVIRRPIEGEVDQRGNVIKSAERRLGPRSQSGKCGSERPSWASLISSTFKV